MFSPSIPAHSHQCAAVEVLNVNSHDVRKLKPCCLCSGIGIYQPANPGIGWPLVICLHSSAVPKRDRRYAHPQCYLNEMGSVKLLTLPPSELEFIRMCDVPSNVMQLLLKQFTIGKTKRLS